MNQSEGTKNSLIGSIPGAKTIGGVMERTVLKSTFTWKGEAVDGYITEVEGEKVGSCAFQLNLFPATAEHLPEGGSLEPLHTFKAEHLGELFKAMDEVGAPDVSRWNSIYNQLE